MRIAVASADVLGASISWNRRRPLSLLLAVSLSGSLLLGCVADYTQQGSSTPSNPPPIPLPKQALLAPPKEPACTLKNSGVSSEDGQAERAEHVSTRVANLATRGHSDEPKGLSVPPPASGAARQTIPMLAQTNPPVCLSQQIKLEYERNCFQQAEMRVRARLLQLQAAIGKTMKAVKRSQAK